ncbi:MAG: T9SS type A sorting domain-containing protein [candidate division KSB1 bacterium]|nr:T9SS type A sorting domain-containing protein [candidate division KSB1 bacterium]
MSASWRGKAGSASRTRWGLLLLGALTCASQPARATDYLVHNLSEFNDAVRKLAPGDTVTLANGIWKDANLIFRANGTASDSIVLRAENPGHVFLTGSSVLRIAGEFLLVDGLRFVGGYTQSGAVVEFRYGSQQAHHSRLTNCSFVDYNPPNKSVDCKWVSLYGTHNRVDHCYFEGKENIGTTLVVWLSSQPNYHRIDHNYFARRPELGTNGGETIRVGTSDWAMYDSYTTVEFNYFEQCNGESEIISSKSCGNVYRYNTFVECEGALTLRHGHRNVVEGNFFFGNRNPRAGGVRVTGEDHRILNNYFCGLYGDNYRAALTLMDGIPHSPPEGYFQVKRALIAFNTFVDCRVSILIGFGEDPQQTLSPEACTFANNLVQTSYQVVRLESEPVGTIWEGNLFWGSKLGLPPTPGIRFEDPRLQPTEDGLWRPAPDSPAIDSAVGDYTFVREDMDGQPRDERKDVGADEVSGSPILRRPLRPEDVGPSWMVELHPVFLGLQTVGQGEIVLDPAGQVYEAETPVRVVAVPSPGWRFSHWEGDLSGVDPQASITLANDAMVRAVFQQISAATYTLRVFVFSSGGHVELDPPGGVYPEGTRVTVTAVPELGWRFKEWGGDLEGSDNPAVLVMDRDKVVLATFERETRVWEPWTIPQRFVLGPCFPNPCNGTTMIPVCLPLRLRTDLTVFDSRGHLVLVHHYGELPAGEHLLRLDGTQLPSGIYLCQVRSGPYSATKQVTVVR